MANWQPYLELDASLVDDIRKAIERLPPLHILPLRAGEVFNSLEACYERL